MKKLFKTTSTVKQSVFTGVAFSLLLTPFHATLAQDDVEDDVDGIEAQLVEETVEADYDDYQEQAWHTSLGISLLHLCYRVSLCVDLFC